MPSYYTITDSYIDALQTQALTPQQVFSKLCDENNDTYFPLQVATLDLKSIAQYFKLLKTLQAQGIPTNSILSLFNLHNRAGDTFGSIVAKRVEQNPSILYLRHLLALLHSQGTLEVVWDLIGNDLLLHLTQNSNQEKVLPVYFQILMILYRKGLSAQEILEAFAMKTSEGFNCGMLLAQHALPDTISNYLRLLKLLSEENPELQVTIEKLMGQRVTLAADEKGNAKSVSFSEIVAERYPVNLLFDVICSGLLSAETYRFLHPFREKISQYIFDMKNLFLKKNALRDALDLQLAIGKFFFGGENPASSTLKSEIEKELKNIHKEDKRNWSLGLFPTPIAEDEEISDEYFELREPPESSNQEDVSSYSGFIAVNFIPKIFKSFWP